MIFKKKNKKPCLVRLDESLIGQVDKSRKKVSLTRSAFIEAILVEYLSNPKKERKI